jgi:uncharacterized protein (DUF952 family)
MTACSAMPIEPEKRIGDTGEHKALGPDLFVPFLCYAVQARLEERMQDGIAFKILLPSELVVLECEGSFAGAPADVAEGFIHMSTAEQLDRTLRKHFADNADVCIAAIDLEALGDQVRWEPSKGGQLYPHLYGPLPLDAVVAYGPLERNDDESIRLPVAK